MNVSVGGRINSFISKRLNKYRSEDFVGSSFVTARIFKSAKLSGIFAYISSVLFFIPLQTDLTGQYILNGLMSLRYAHHNKTRVTLFLHPLDPMYLA